MKKTLTDVPRGTTGQGFAEQRGAAKNVGLWSMGNLVMQTKEKDCADNDGGQKDLTDVVVKDLLVRGGGITEVGFFFAGRFGGHLADRGGYVLFCVHVQ